jgi:hypothetical protein
VLGGAVERSVAKAAAARPSAPASTPLSATSGVAHHALPEQLDRAWQVAALQLAKPLQ